MSERDQVGNSSGEPGLTQLLQALLTTREEEKHWGRARQEKELAQHQEERKVQIDLMKALLEEATLNSVPRQSQPNIHFRKLTEADDIEACLTTFERLVTSEKLEQRHWAFKLTPYLTGKAQPAYAALSSEEAADYTKLNGFYLSSFNRIDLESKKPVSFIWTEKHQKAFEEVKQSLVSAPLLHPLDCEKELFHWTDASLVGFGAVLE